LHIVSLLDVWKAKVKSQIREKPDLKRLAAYGVVMIVCVCYHSEDKANIQAVSYF